MARLCILQVRLLWDTLPRYCGKPYIGFSFIIKHFFRPITATGCWRIKPGSIPDTGFLYNKGEEIHMGVYDKFQNACIKPKKISK